MDYVVHLLLLVCLLRYNLHMKIFILSVAFNEFSKFAKLYDHKPLLFHNAVLFPCVWHPVFDCIEAYAPGFKGSVVGRDILTPPDLERVFGLPGGVSSYRTGGSRHSFPSLSLHLHSLTCPDVPTWLYLGPPHPALGRKRGQGQRPQQREDRDRVSCRQWGRREEM